MRITPLVAALSAVAAVASGCAPFAQGSAAPSPGADRYQPQPAGRLGGTAVLADFEYPQTLNPLTAATDLELRLAGLVFAPLWGFDDALRPYPDLVREVPTPANGGVKTASDGRSMTLDVRLLPGLHWSDGQPLTADDVSFTLQAVRDPDMHPAVTEGLDRIREVQRRSDTELVVTFDGAYGPYLQLGAALFVMPAHRLAGVPHREWVRDAFFQHPDVASGPFVVSEAIAGQRLLFDANPRYGSGQNGRRHEPYLGRLLFVSESGKAALLAALSGQAVDLAFHLTPDDIHALNSVVGAAPAVFTGLRDVFVSPNHRANTATGRAPPWLDDRRVLDALERGIDRSALVREAFGGAGKPARGLYPQALRGFAQGSLLPPGRDLEGARRLLDDAGWRPAGDGIRTREGRRLEFGLLGLCGGGAGEGIAQALGRQWQDLGAAAASSCLPRDRFLQAGAAGAFDMVLASNGWGPDPDAWAAFGAGGGDQNWAHCQDRSLDAAFTRGASTPDAAARRSAYQAAERAWLAYGCTLPLAEWPEVRGVSLRLHNFAPSPGLGSDTWNAADWWLTPAP